MARPPEPYLDPGVENKSFPFRSILGHGWSGMSEAAVRPEG